MERTGLRPHATVAATALTLSAALIAAIGGHVAAGFVLFVAAATPLPVLASRSLRQWLRAR